MLPRKKKRKETSKRHFLWIWLRDKNGCNASNEKYLSPDEPRANGMDSVRYR